MRDAGALKQRLLKTAGDQALMSADGAKLTTKIMTEFQTTVKAVKAKADIDPKITQSSNQGRGNDTHKLSSQSHNQSKEKASASQSACQANNQSKKSAATSKPRIQSSISTTKKQVKFKSSNRQATPAEKNQEKEKSGGGRTLRPATTSSPERSFFEAGTESERAESGSVIDFPVVNVTDDLDKLRSEFDEVEPVKLSSGIIHWSLIVWFSQFVFWSIH